MHRGGFLEPWMSVLRRQCVYGMHQRRLSPFEPVQLYIRITLTAAQDEAQMIREGLKLLAAAAYVDCYAWKKLRLSHDGTPYDTRWEQDTDKGTIAQFQVRIGNDGGTVDDLVQLCGVHQHDHPRREFSEALARIAAMDAKKDVMRRGVEILVPVVAFFTEDLSPRKLLKLRDAQRRCKWKESSSLAPVQQGGLRCTFALSAVNAELIDFFGDSIGLALATNMQQLIDENVWFSHISMKLEFTHEGTRLRKEIYGRLWSSIFGSTRRSNESQMQYWAADNNTSRIHQQVDHISIEPVGQDRHGVEAICSAAVQSQTVRELKLTYMAKPNDSVHWWQWIAYAFFSKRARTLSSLEGLTLTNIERMTDAEIEAFCGILASENPEEELLGCSCGRVGLQEATLTANSPIRWDFRKFGKPVLRSGVVKFPTPIPFLWITNRSERAKWVDALVPGYGRCQVLRRNLIFNDPVNRATPGNDLTALEIHFSYNIGRYLSGLPHFFAAVGSTLKKLTIYATIQDMNMEMVLERCPNLETLCFTKHWNTAIFSFSEYQAAGSPVPVFPFRFGDTFGFTEELMNPDSDLAKCLQHLTLHPNYQDDGNDLDELEALLKMLENNRRLEYLDIKLVRTGSYVEKFKKFHLQPINRSVKIDTPSKVAFLSVLSTPSIPQIKKRQRETGGKRKNWEHFDANVVTNIFQFAAAPLLRKVYVENNPYT